MGKIVYRCMRPNEKPEWLLRLQYDISAEFCAESYSVGDLPVLQQYIDNKIRGYITSKIIKRSIVNTTLLKDEGRTVLWISRNGIPLQQYFIKD